MVVFYLSCQLRSATRGWKRARFIDINKDTPKLSQIGPEYVPAAQSTKIFEIFGLQKNSTPKNLKKCHFRVYFAMF